MFNTQEYTNPISEPVIENVAKAAGTNPTKAEFDALITALIASGLMAAE